MTNKTPSLLAKRSYVDVSSGTEDTNCNVRSRLGLQYIALFFIFIANAAKSTDGGLVIYLFEFIVFLRISRQVRFQSYCHCTNIDDRHEY